MKRTAALSILLPILLPAWSHAQQDAIPLHALREQAAAYHEGVRLNAAAARQAHLSTTIASAARLPRVDLTAGYTHVSEVGRIELAIPGIGTRSISLGDGNIYESALSVTVPLFTGFRLSNSVALQQTMETMAQQTLAGSVTDVRNAVAVQYRLAQAARKSAEIIDAQEQLLRENLAARRRLLEQGQALALDTLQLATRILQLGVERNTASSVHDRAILTLMQFTGRDMPFEVESFAEEATDLESMTTDQLLEIAVKERSEMRNLEASVRAAELAESAARGAYYPSVYASAALRHGRPGVDQFKNDWMTYYTAALRLEWNVWSWGSDRSAVEKQQIEKEKSQLRESQYRAQLRTAIALLLNDLSVKAGTVAMLEAQVAMERSRVDIVQARFNGGLATATELVEAETGLTTALLKLEQTRIERAIKRTELAAAIGKEF